MKPLSVAIIGCGAISELYYAPVLSSLQASCDVRVELLFDPDSARTSKLSSVFPEAKVHNRFAPVIGHAIDMAIVASPPRFHAEQAIELLKRGVAVLCEKPMAATVAEADEMVEAARQAKRVLAIGLFRRFFPVNQSVLGIIQNQSFGPAKSFEISEGGIFDWPAQSASFFQKSKSQGGVLADLGVHVLDLLIWWFGMPTRVNYGDDAMGGLEANCLIELEFANGVSGVVRLSRDTKLPNRTIIEFERGWLRFKGGAADEFEVGFSGVSFTAESKLKASDTRRPHGFQTKPAPSYGQSFFMQLQNVVTAVRGETEVFIPGQQGVLSLRLIEQCYRQRKLMTMPWLTKQEMQTAKAIIGVAE